jgi:hypothetical protein
MTKHYPVEQRQRMRVVCQVRRPRWRRCGAPRPLHQRLGPSVAAAKKDLTVGSSQGVSGVGAGAGAVAAVRLGGRTHDPGTGHVVVLRLAGLVAVSGGAARVGSHPADAVGCVDATLWVIGGAPTYALTDNEKTMTVEHVARVPIRHPHVVAAGRHYGMTIPTCVPADPQSKGGAEATVRIPKPDLVPTEANLLERYATFGELQQVCRDFHKFPPNYLVGVHSSQVLPLK